MFLQNMMMNVLSHPKGQLPDEDRETRSQRRKLQKTVSSSSRFIYSLMFLQNIWLENMSVVVKHF